MRYLKVATTVAVAIAVSLLFTVAGPAEAGWNPLAKEKTEKRRLTDRTVADTVTNFKNADSSLLVFFRNAYGYAVFPTIGKAGMGIGGAHGKGKVYKKGRFIGLTSLTQVTFGFQLGVQSYSEIIFFRDKTALDNFTDGNYELGAQVSAVAATSGASANADYDDGVAIFTLTKGGLMYEASVGGQKFSFTRQ